MSSAVAEDLPHLLKNSPFEPQGVDRATAPVQTQLELRGVVVESGVVWFTFYDVAAKRWMTVREGEEAESLRVKSYDRTREYVVLNFAGKTLSLALKPAGNQSYGGAGIAAVASTTAPKAAVPQPIIVPTLPEAEARRLEIVTAAIRRQNEQAKFRAPAAGNAGS